MISVDFPNEEIRTVLRNVADLYMLNIVIPEDLQGTTSIKLRDVSWKQIFSVVLEPIGYTYVEEGNIIQIISNDTLNFEPPITDIFMLNYAEASDIAATVTNMVDAEKGGRVQIDARTNSLIVTERQSRMSTIRQVIERLDKPTLQVMIETRFVEVTNQDVSKIGVKWNSLEEFEVKAEGISRGYSNLDTRLGNNTRGTENNTEDNFGEVDLSFGDASISGLPGSRNGQFVNNLTGQTLLDASTNSGTNLQQSAIRNLTDLVHGGNLQRTTSAIFSTSQIGYIFSALKKQGNSRLVSHPTVVTLNNQEAEISIGEQFPIPNYQYNEERGSFEVAGFDYKDIGVILKVKPSVNNEGLITLRVNPEVSSRTGEREFGGASGASIPIISTRRTETQISLKDGYTMGLGGLLQASSIEEESKVPLLHKIPGLGAAFRHKEKDGQKMNLLIFITAKILSSEDSDFEDVFSQTQMEDVGIDPDEIRNQ
jgi:type IV pilus assembly protein PilQ